MSALGIDGAIKQGASGRYTGLYCTTSELKSSSVYVYFGNRRTSRLDLSPSSSYNLSWTSSLTSS